MLPMKIRSLALIAAVVSLAALAATPALAAKVKLSTVKGDTVKLLGTKEYAYASDNTVWFACKGKAKAFMVGWSGPNAPVAIIYSHVFNSDGQMALAQRKPMKSGSFKSFARCASGPIAAKAKSAKGTIKCSKKQVAIGVPIDNGPYYQGAAYSKPVGTRGWTSNDEGHTGAKVICASKKAFKRANLVKATTTFKPGARTATVSATCKGGQVPISWGFEAGAMEGNAWASDTASIKAPLISKSRPKGRSGWSLTYFTPDGRGAVERTPVGIHLTCAKPA